ncbi:hypothetical protein BofuT4_uP075890.1 [Botrytis cinerea T4]|uniref:Uncharacterized protein n=1 Tax=Botryotinia fuckeliana (strain T4) TaxID=999810 RepID=G2XNQ0_BOTF4|nr:hypothetical protein BofuT4_uP075890.1 [Botrytis cinerea T4]
MSIMRPGTTTYTHSTAQHSTARAIAINVERRRLVVAEDLFIAFVPSIHRSPLLH